MRIKTKSLEKKSQGTGCVFVAGGIGDSYRLAGRSMNKTQDMSCITSPIETGLRHVLSTRHVCLPTLAATFWWKARRERCSSPFDWSFAFI